MKFLSISEQQRLQQLQTYPQLSLQEASELNNLIETRQNNVLKTHSPLSVSPVVNSVSYLEQVNIFTNKSEASRILREKLYMDYMKQNQLKTMSDAKWEILKETFSRFVRSEMISSLQLARENQGVRAKEKIDLLKKMSVIFKTDYDVSNFDGFVCDVDKNMTLVSAAAIFGRDTFLINEEALNNFSHILSASIVPQKSSVEGTEDYLSKLIEHPLLNCLDAFKHEKNLINNIREKHVDLGFYHDLAMTILELKEKNTTENYDALIMFLINEDIEHGLGNIVQSQNYEPRALRKVLSLVQQRKVPDAKLIDDLIHNDIIPKFSKNYEETITGIEERINSKFSANDSGYYFKAAGRKNFIHIHTASDKGQNQRLQQVNTYNLFQKYGHDLGIDATLSLTLVDHHIVSDNKNGYLAGQEDTTSQFTDFDKYFLTSLVFESGFFTNIANQVQSVEEMKNSRTLSENVSIIRDMRQISTDVIRAQIEHSDYEIVAAKSKQLVTFMKSHADFFKSIFKSTATAGQLRYELLHKNVLTTIKATLNIQEQTHAQFFNKEELEFVQEILNVSSPPFCREVSINEIAKDSKKTLSYILRDTDPVEVSALPLYTSIIRESQLKKENMHLNSEILEDKLFLSGMSHDAKFEFAKEPSIQGAAKMIDYFNEHPHKISKVGKRIRTSIDDVYLQLPYFTKLKRALDALDAQMLSRDIKKGDTICFNKDALQTIDKCIINLLKSENKAQARDTVLCNLFCLYAKTYGVSFDLSKNSPKGALKNVKL